ncbi:MAG TPA: Hpt domain-containing protein, partial [Pararobbsia sp.]|nr:Hpt domain-containing protein [Pararobbsia sp.]
MSTDDDLSRLSLEELFQQEAQTQSRVLTDGLLALERSPGDAATLEACMRAAHSLKGAARIVGLQRGVDIAHRMEDCFVHAQQGLVGLRTEHIDRLLEGVDLLLHVAGNTDPRFNARIDAFLSAVEQITTPATQARISSPARDADDRVPANPSHLGSLNTHLDTPGAPIGHTDADLTNDPSPGSSRTSSDAGLTLGSPVVSAIDVQPDTPREMRTDMPADMHAAAGDRLLRVSAARLDRVLGLSGEALVDARWLHPFGESLQRLKRMQREASQSLDRLHDALVETGLDTTSRQTLDALRHSVTES